MKVVIIALVSIFVSASAQASIYSMNAVQNAEQGLNSQIPALSDNTIVESNNSNPVEGTLYTGPDSGSAQPTGEYLASNDGVLISGPDYADPALSSRQTYSA